MAEKYIDRMLKMTDSKYRLSVVVAKRAQQLAIGAPSVLSDSDKKGINNLVTLSMREMATGQLTTGQNIIDEKRFFQDYQRARQAEIQRQVALDNLSK